MCIGLARGGFKGDPLGYTYVDYSWLVITTTCGFCIVMFLLIIGRAMGGMPPQVVDYQTNRKRNLLMLKV